MSTSLNPAAVIQTARPPFLLLTPLCLLLGLGVALHLGSSISLSIAVMVFVAALSAHISVNCLNEYVDFESGLDLNTIRTPFSGGSGALPNHPAAAQAALILALVSLLVSIIVGLYLASITSWWLLSLGLLGVAIILTYTHWLNRMPYLCLFAPGLCFGPIMVIGSAWVFSGQFSVLAVLVSLVPFFLVNNLLLLNQYPDIDADSSVGRRTIPIVLGVKRSTHIYAVFALAAYLLLALLMIFGFLPTLAVIALLPFPLALLSYLGALRYGECIVSEPKYLAMNVIVSLLTPALLGVSLLLTV